MNPEIIIKKDLRDLSPTERAQRFRRDIEGADREERRRTLLRYLTGDPRQFIGRTTIADAVGAAIVPWRQSTTALGKPGQPTRIRRGSFKAPSGLFNAAPPPKRSPLQRVESMTQRYVDEWKRGNHAILDKLLSDICGEYWRQGQPITVEALRMLAAKSLQDAEARLKGRDARRTARQWNG